MRRAVKKVPRNALFMWDGQLHLFLYCWTTFRGHDVCVRIAGCSWMKPHRARPCGRGWRVWRMWRVLDTVSRNALHAGSAGYTCRVFVRIAPSLPCPTGPL